METSQADSVGDQHLLLSQTGWITCDQLYSRSFLTGML